MISLAFTWISYLLALAGLWSIAVAGTRWYRLRAQLGAAKVRRYDPSTHGYRKFAEWSRRRELASDAFVVREVAPREQTWFDPAKLEAARTRFPDPGGPTWYLVAVDHVDHRESDDHHSVAIAVAPAHFVDYRALRHLVNSAPEVIEAMNEKVDSQDLPIEELLAGSPPSSFDCHVALVTGDARVLMVRRSSSVGEFPNCTTVGLIETAAKVSRDGAQRPETPFETAYRAVREEAGIDPNEVDSLKITWFGYRMAEALALSVFVATTKLTSPEVEERIMKAHSGWEHASLFWIGYSRASLRQSLSAFEKSTGNWHPSGGLVIRELLRSMK